MKTIFGFCVFAVLLVLKADCQTFIKNDSITFRTIRVSSVIKEDGIIPAGYFIKVQLNAAQRQLYQTMNKVQWIKLLGDSTSDWAANLILYDLYRENAISYVNHISNRQIWVNTRKRKKDIQH